MRLYTTCLPKDKDALHTSRFVNPVLCQRVETHCMRLGFVYQVLCLKVETHCMRLGFVYQVLCLKVETHCMRLGLVTFARVDGSFAG
jgi:hypothetical protein